MSVLQQTGCSSSVVVSAHTLADIINATCVSWQGLFWQIILWDWLCTPPPPWLPWGHMKPEASLENTFWVLGLTAWSHWCTCQKRAATQELCFHRTKLPCGGVGGACTELPELTRDTWAQQNYQTFIFPSAFCLLLCNGLTQAVGPASWGQPLAGNTEREAQEKEEKNLKTILSREAEASVGYKPECQIKDSRGCSLYLQQHSRESREGQSAREEKKAPYFIIPAIIAQGCEALPHFIQWLFTSFYHFPQKVSI